MGYFDTFQGLLHKELFFQQISTGMSYLMKPEERIIFKFPQINFFSGKI